MELTDRHVLVTGASRGIGRGLVAAFTRAGARVSGVARSPDDLEEALATAGGGAFVADLTETDRLEELVARIEREAGPVDVLVNNAAISRVGYALDTDPADIDDVLRLNLHAPALLCRHLLPRMLDRGRGHVVNVSSMAAVLSTPGLAYYGATKAGLDQFTAGLRQDLRGLPVGTTLVHLGSVDTGLDDQSRRYGPIRAVSQGRGDDRLDVDEVAEAIVRAVFADRRHVRLPRMLAPLPALAEGPRRVGELLFGRVPPREGAGGPGGDRR